MRGRLRIKVWTCEQGRGRYQRDQWRLLGVELVVLRNFHWKRSNIGIRGARKAAAMKLSPACSNVDLLRRARTFDSGKLRRTKFCMDKPRGLREEGQEQQTG